MKYPYLNNTSLVGAVALLGNRCKFNVAVFKNKNAMAIINILLVSRPLVVQHKLMQVGGDY